MKTILTGIRANSELHLGHFLGVILPITRLANKYSKTHNINIFIPDLHSIISDIEGDLHQNVLTSIKNYLAAGLELNENIHFYRQSRVPAHSELCWILNCTANMGELSRMTQYKDKGEGKASANVGIFDYPVLMAADILLYDAEYVPVGEDQFQHLELTRNLAERFNHKYSEIFTLPLKTAEQAKFMGQNNGEGIRIRDLSNPAKKMSKSTLSENSKIMLSDTPERATKKIMSATTDNFAKIQFDMQNQPGISNLLQIEALLNDIPLQDVISTWAGETHYGDLKQKVAESVREFLDIFHTKLDQIENQKIEDLLLKGEKYANEVANKKLNQVQEVIGLR